MEKTVRQRADQDQVIQNFVTETSELLSTTRKDNKLVSELEKLGIDNDFLTKGDVLTANLQEKFTLRQQKIGEKDAANQAVELAYGVVVTRFTDFREVVRLAFTEEPARRTLGAVGRVPADKQKLVTLMRASLTTARSAPYAAELTRRSYDSAACAAALSEVDALDSALSQRDHVGAEATAATKERNAAYAEVRAWRNELGRALKRARARR